MKFILAIVLLVGFFLPNNVLAAPAPTLFAYNDSTKQCGTFRDGDEYVSYTLPQGWKTYDYEKSIAKTPQQYCDELGYTNIGSIVSYFNLEPKSLRTQEPNYPYGTKHFNYPLLITLIVVFSAITLIGITILIKNKRSNKFH